MKRTLATAALAVSVLGTLALTSAPVFAKSVSPNPNPGGGEFHWTMAPSAIEEQQVNRVAIHILKNIVVAREGILHKDNPLIGEALQENLNLIQRMRSMCPTHAVKEQLWVAKKHLELDTPKEVLQDLLPIEVSLTGIGDMFPVEEPKALLREARTQLEAGNIDAARKTFETIESRLVIQEVEMPLNRTESLMMDAQKSIALKDYTSADRYLKQAEDNIQTLGLMVSSPMFYARRNLWQAAQAYQDRNLPETRLGLSQAGFWLNKATNHYDTAFKSEVDSLYREVRQSYGQLEKGGPELGQKLMQYMNRAEAMTQKEVRQFTGN